jgi:hypothetical protein
MDKCLYKYLFAFFLVFSLTIEAQNDTIRLKDNTSLTGEIKSLSTGILTMETAFSDKDFKIEFNKVEEIIISRKCIISLTNSRRYYSNIKSETPGTFTLFFEDGTSTQFKMDEMTGLIEVNEKFWKRLKFGLDLGYNFTKANNNAQFTISSNFNFVGEKWLLKGYINVLNSSQDSVKNVKRTDAMIEAIRPLQNKWYMLSDVSFLSNTEQALKGRVSPSLGLGRFIKSTNKLYFGLSLGATYNIENYEDATLNKTSSEAFLSSSFNMYDFKDFDLKTGIKFYAGLSEKGRIRTDYDITIKYDLPWDFYIKTEFTLNYDNQPAVSGTELDYIFTSGFGYKFD